jgi:hypothetical protein
LVLDAPSLEKPKRFGRRPLDARTIASADNPRQEVMMEWRSQLPTGYGRVAPCLLVMALLSIPIGCTGNDSGRSPDPVAPQHDAVASPGDWADARGVMITRDASTNVQQAPAATSFSAAAPPGTNQPLSAATITIGAPGQHINVPIRRHQLRARNPISAGLRRGELHRSRTDADQ